MGPLNEMKEPRLYAAIRALFGQPIANTRILTLTAVGINLCGLSGNCWQRAEWRQYKRQM